MIKQEHIENQRTNIPWKKDSQIEQDMVISRAIVDMYNNPIIRENLIFRGGTALNKLFLKPPARYSEDIDFVLIEEKPIGFLMDAIKETLQWIGKPRTTRDKWGFKVIYPFENIDNGKSKLKIETNCTENFKYNPLRTVSFSIESGWFSGGTSVITYDLEELMATKLRAVYQRRKGRDLFDVWHIFSKGLVDIENVIRIFHAYNKYNDAKITQKMFLQNLEQKYENRDFRQDIRILLPIGTDYNFDNAFDFVMKKVLPHI